MRNPHITVESSEVGDPPAAADANINPNDTSSTNTIYATMDQVELIVNRQFEKLQFLFTQHITKPSSSSGPILSILSDSEEKEFIQLAASFTGQTYQQPRRASMHLDRDQFLKVDMGDPQFLSESNIYHEPAITTKLAEHLLDKVLMSPHAGESFVVNYIRTQNRIPQRSAIPQPLPQRSGIPQPHQP